MTGWSMVVDLVRALVFTTAHLCGNSIGGGVLTVSLLVRIALLPVTLRAARRMLAHQERIAALAPELERLRRRHGDDSAGLAEATMALYRRHDIGLVPRGMLGPMLVQFPIGAALYQAVSSGLGRRVSFLWVPDLARPDALVAAAAALLAAVATASGPSPASRGTVAVSAAITFVLAWRLSASVALYWVASNGVSAVQSVLLRRSSNVPRIT
jgi:YidC/Oxa1 family membrane protein insertase